MGHGTSVITIAKIQSRVILPAGGDAFKRRLEDVFKLIFYCLLMLLLGTISGNVDAIFEENIRPKGYV